MTFTGKQTKRLPQKKPQRPPVQDQLNVLIEQTRLWRDDAFNQRSYSSAIFWGEKVLSMTASQDPMDIYSQAQIYYSNQEYLKCKELLSRKMLSYSSLWCKLLAAQCCVKLAEWDETLELLGESMGFQSQQALDVRLSNSHGRGIQIEASLYYIRGLAYMNNGSKQLAKEMLLLALQKDLRCFDALQALLDNYMLTSDEQAKLLVSLPLDKLPSFEAEFIKSLYFSRLSPLGTPEEVNKVHETLLHTYRLSSSPLVLVGKAQFAMIRHDYEMAEKLLETILKEHQYHEEALVLYMICLSAMERVTRLFTLAHEMVELFPKKAFTWFGVGTYYLSIQNYAESRRYFGKATEIEPSFGQAWIGFAHSFALEGEHDSALAVYSSACKVLPGSHIPKMYLGMEHARLKNWKLAEEFLLVALDACSSDPLLHNELGSLYYEKEEYELAIDHFSKVLDLVGKGTPKRIWISTLCNLGHAYRKKGQYQNSRKYFNQVNELLEAQESAYSGLALIAEAENNFELAIHYLHQALSINPDNRECALLLDTLLNQVADVNSKNPLPILGVLLDSDLLDAQLQQKLAADGDDCFVDTEQNHILSDPDEISIFRDEHSQDDSIQTTSIPASPKIAPKTVLKSRLSNLFEVSPEVGENRPRKGLLNFHGSSPIHTGARTPPHHQRPFFASREDSPFESPSQHRLEDSDVFGAEEDIEMDYDDSD